MTMLPEPRIVVCFAHIPMVELPAELQEMEIGDGMLVRLPFEQWACLDRTALAHENGYRKSAPVFFRMYFSETEEVGLEETLQWARAQFDQELYLAYFCLLALSGWRLPEPDLSKQYYWDPAHGSGTLREAAFGYEALAYASPEDLYPLSKELLDKAALFVQRIRRIGQFLNLPEISYARDVLFTLARPEFTHVQDLVYCCTAVEALFVPRQVESVTETLCRRAGIFMARRHEERDQAAAIFRALYDLRSRLVHGESYAESEGQLAKTLPRVPPALAARWLLGQILWKLFRLADERPGNVKTIPDLAAALDDAHRDRTQYDVLGLAAEPAS